MLTICNNSGIIFNRDITENVNYPHYSNFINQVFCPGDWIKIILVDKALRTSTDMRDTYTVYLCNNNGEETRLSYQLAVTGSNEYYGIIAFSIPMNTYPVGSICWIKISAYSQSTGYIYQYYYSKPFKIIDQTFNNITISNKNRPCRKISAFITGSNSHNYNGIYMRDDTTEFFPEAKFGIRVPVSFYRTPSRVHIRDVFEEHFGKKTNLLVESLDVYSIKFCNLTREEANVVSTLLNTEYSTIADEQFILYSEELEEISVDGVKEITLSGDFIRINDGIINNCYVPMIQENPLRFFVNDIHAGEISQKLRILRVGRKENQTDIGNN